MDIKLELLKREQILQKLCEALTFCFLGGQSIYLHALDSSHHIIRLPSRGLASLHNPTNIEGSHHSLPENKNSPSLIHYQMA